MPPLQNGTIHQTRLSDDIIQETSKEPETKRNGYFEQDLVWKNVIVYVITHSLALLAIWRLATGQLNWKNFAFNVCYGYLCVVGVTGGAHRLWSHKSYKAKTPLRMLLMLMQTCAIQNDIYVWARDHRLHHKYTDTDADPHNSRRGFFFAHVGWLLMKKHPQVILKGKTIDCSDVAKDPVVKFQRRYYFPLAIYLSFIFPTVFSMVAFGESFLDGFLGSVLKYILNLNGTWSVNSAAHIWGWKPYDSTINPVENPTVSIITLGEGWHNYHHVFPWDYKASELGFYKWNVTTAFLDLMAHYGQAYDLKTVSEEMIRKRVARTGDGSYKNGKIPVENGKADENHNFYENAVWGWSDKDMKDEDINDVNIKFKHS